tara:strand:- start:2 stop:286 length:285 start_codon:yes stop_codon:yes gene_type:complete
MEPPETGGIGMLSRLHQAIASPNWVIPSRLVVACIRGARLSETGFAGYPRIPGAIVRLLLLRSRGLVMGGASVESYFFQGPVGLRPTGPEGAAG